MQKVPQRIVVFIPQTPHPQGASTLHGPWGPNLQWSLRVSEMMSLIDPRDLGVILRHGRKFLRVRGEERSHWPACVFSSRNDPVEEKKISVPRCSTARGYCIRLKIRTKCESTYCSVKLNYDTSQKVRYTNQRCEEHTG